MCCLFRKEKKRRRFCSWYQLLTFCGLFSHGFFSREEFLVAVWNFSLIFRSVDLTSQKNKTFTLIGTNISIWILGYPDLPGGMVVQLFLGGAGLGAWWQEIMYSHESVNRTKTPQNEHTKNKHGLRGEFFIAQCLCFSFWPKNYKTLIPPWIPWGPCSTADCCLGSWDMTPSQTMHRGQIIPNYQYRCALCFIPPLSHSIHVWYMIYIYNIEINHSCR